MKIGSHKELLHQGQQGQLLGLRASEKRHTGVYQLHHVMRSKCLACSRLAATS